MIKIRITNPNAKIPIKAHQTDAGYDLTSVDQAIIPPGERKVIDTGIQIQFPEYEHYYLRIAPRSGLSVKHGINVLAGVIDKAYTGNILVCLHNADLHNTYTVNIGDKIAQMIPTQIMHLDSFEIVDELEITERNNAGFGSTGK